MKLAGKWALVTGSGRGIGKGCALELARAGADIILNDRPGSPDLASAADEVLALGRNFHAMEADIFSRPECEKFVARAVELTGGIDILISNPAASIRGAFLDFDPADFERVIRGALISGFHMSQLVARDMVRRASKGKIIFISSVHAPMPYAGSVAYNAAKAGLNHMARTIAVELAPHRINVNAIEPGWIDTPGEHIAFGAEMIEREGPNLPWGRLGTPADIGKAAVFLASDDADYISSETLRVDGCFIFKSCASEI